MGRLLDLTFNHKRDSDDYLRVDGDIHLMDEIELILEIQEKFSLTYDQILETLKLLENRRKNNILVEIADLQDEHIERMVEAVEDMCGSHRGIAVRLENCSDGLHEVAHGIGRVADVIFDKLEYSS
jgi:methyl-accepting chemotaxis protein